MRLGSPLAGRGGVTKVVVTWGDNLTVSPFPAKTDDLFSHRPLQTAP